MELAGKHILVVGLGRTGLATARFLKNRKAVVTVTDSAVAGRLAPQLKILRDLGVRSEIGRHRPETFFNADLIVVSPGVSLTIEPLQAASKKGIDILGEIELAARFIRDPIIAVSGTNGKTTTVSLLGEIFAAAGRKAFVGGNIGNPLIEYVDRNESADCLILEVSSFQLDTIETFHPRVAVLLNVTPDHLDRYPDFSAYLASKNRIFKNQDKNDVAVLNASDPAIAALSRKIAARKMYFGTEASPGSARYPAAAIRSDGLTIHDGSNPATEIDLSGSHLRGRHNLENMAAAALAAAARGIAAATIESALKNFKGLPHRLEFITTREGVAYYNDSKATNIDSVVRALDAFPGPIILILGGRSKGEDVSLLVDAVRRQVKKLIALGESREAIRAVFAEIVPTFPAATMAQAVSLAQAGAVPGDTVLLSPGCASFDLYANYAQRGEDFRRWVLAK